ncbi:hypothetical protein FRB95_011058 [Tulasnella sp. JGI-2019a]|nr:hypothetical protein FRB95_011058 [Tulasnella sp. JGI-2019a]
MAYVHHFDFTAQARRLVFALGVTLVVTPVISLLSFKVFAIVLVNQVVFAWASRSNTASSLGGIPRPSFSAGVAATLFLIVARYLNPAPDIARAIGTPATLSCLHYVLEKRARRELETRDIRTPSEERQHRTAIRFSQWLSSIILHVLGCWSYPSSDLSLLTGFLAVVWTLFEIFQIALGTLQALKEFAKNNDPETIRTTLLHLRRQTGFLVSRWIISILCTFVRRSLQLSIALTTTGTFLVRSNGQVSDALERTLTTHHQLQCLTINFLEKQLAALWILVASGQDIQETEEERNGQISLKLADKDHAELSQDDILFLYKWLPTSRRASFFEAHTLYLMAKSPPPADARIVHEDSLSPAEVGAADLEVNQDHSNPQFDITDPRTITLPLLPISKPIQSRSQRITSFASAEADTPAPSSSTPPDPEFQPLPEPNHAPLLLSKLVFVASAFRRLEYIFRMEPLDSETAAWILTCDHENFCQVVGPRFSVVEERLVTHLAELQSRNNDLDTELADVKAAYDILHSTCADIQRDFVELSACYDALREARQTQVGHRTISHPCSTPITNAKLLLRSTGKLRHHSMPRHPTPAHLPSSSSSRIRRITKRTAPRTARWTTIVRDQLWRQTGSSQTQGTPARHMRRALGWARSRRSRLGGTPTTGPQKPLFRRRSRHRRRSTADHPPTSDSSQTQSRCGQLLKTRAKPHHGRRTIGTPGALAGHPRFSIRGHDSRGGVTALAYDFFRCLYF